MRIISWNINGLSDRQKTKRIIRKLRKLKADVIILQEIYKNNTNLNQEQLAKRVEEIASFFNLCWHADTHFDANGHIAILSPYHKAINITTSLCNGRIVDFTFTHMARGDRKIQIPYFSINMRALYAPAATGEKQPFWRSFPPLPPLCWVVGDFNMGLKKCDRTASTSSDNPGNANDILANHIDTSHALQDKNPNKTFFRKKLLGMTKSRIDYIFAPENALQPHASFRTVDPGLDSDHQILILDNKSRRKSRPEWRMNISHLTNSYVDSHIKNLLLHPHYSWDGIKIQIKEYLQEHGRKQQKKLNDNILNLTNRLSKLRQQNSNVAEINLVRNRLLELESKLAERLAIKSGAQWLEEGERSTKYFFSRYKQKLQFATIETLKDTDGNNLATAMEKIQAIYEHQQKIWDKSNTQDPSTFPWFCPKLEDNAIRSLNQAITLEEVQQAIAKSPNNKAPGPDGIPSEFYTHYQNLLAPKLRDLFNDILLHGTLPPESWKHSKCVLIPKKTTNIDQLANWRPITLENCDLKIFSRILSNRTQQIISDIIGPEQTGFIAGRRIHHSVLTIDAALHTEAEGSYLLSLDWSKAYDRVSFKWLSYCLNKFGFPQEYVRSIERLFYSREANISIDNETATIHCGQGVPQGDPIAPLLFVIALEPMLQAARHMVTGIHTPFGMLTNTAFADDSTFFVRNNFNLAKLELLLENYCDVSGAVVNWGKSALTPLSSKPPPTESKFPLTLIKSPPPTLGYNFPLDQQNSITTWNKLIHKMEATANLLKSRKSLTYAGRVLLCRSLVLSKGWYVATALSPTLEQTQKIERLFWDFVFGKGVLHPKRAVAILPKKCGGINAPKIVEEFQTYAAHLYYQAMMNPSTPWAYHLLKKAAPNNIHPYDLAEYFFERSKRSVANRYSDPTIYMAIKGWNSIHKQLGELMILDLSHKDIRELILPKPQPIQQPALIWLPKLASETFKWELLWTKEMPPKIRNLVWRAAFNALPCRRRLRHYTDTDKHCTLCREPEDSIHMIISCTKLRQYWRQIDNLTLYVGVENEATANIIYGIAYYSVYLSNIFSRMHGTTYKVQDIYWKFRALSKHFFLRLPQHITKDWPTEEDLTRFLR